MNKVLWVMIILWVNLFALGAQRKIGFVEEYIDFEIDSMYFSINGIYTFANRGMEAGGQHIFFPFAEVQQNIDSIRIVNLSTMQQVPFRKQAKGISFSLNVCPKDTVDLNIFYRQKTARKNVYIVTTTSFWGEPLNTAVYSLATPLEIDSFSYKPDSMEVKQNEVYYFWKKKDFMPTSDFEFLLKTKD